MDKLPDEIFLEVFNYFGGKQLKNIMFVCKRWHNIITKSASTMRMLPLSYSNIEKLKVSHNLFNFHTLSIRHTTCLNFDQSILTKGIGDSIQSIEISYCSLSANDLNTLSTCFNNLKTLNLVKVKLLRDRDLDVNYCDKNEILLDKMSLQMVDHEILKYLTNLQPFEIEIYDSSENTTNEQYLTKFIINQKHLISLTIGEMSNNASVFFHSATPIDYKFKLKKLHTIFCSNYSQFPKFEENFLTFLKSQSEHLKSIKFSGRSLPTNIFKFAVCYLKNLDNIELDASSIPQENSFYENLPKNFCLKSLTVNSTVNKNNFNEFKQLLNHYPNVMKLNLMDTDEFIPNDLFHSVSCFLKNLKELSVLNFSKSFDPQSKIKSLETFSIKILTDLDQLVKFISIHDETLKTLSIWWIVRDFESSVVRDIISLSNLSHLKIGGRFIANKRIYEVIRSDCKNLKSLHLIVNNYDEVKHLKFTFPTDKSLYTSLKCSYFEEYHDREPLND